jgi:hypothetical protein
MRFACRFLQLVNVHYSFNDDECFFHDSNVSYPTYITSVPSTLPLSLPHISYNSHTMGLLSNPLDNLARGKIRSKSDASSIGNLSISGHGQQEAGGGGGSGSGESGDPNDTTKLDEDQGNVLMSIIQQRAECFPPPLHITSCTNREQCDQVWI